MLVLSWQMTLAVGAGDAAILLVVHLVIAPAKAAGTGAVRANGDLASRISQGLAGLRTIRLFSHEADELTRFSCASTGVRPAVLRMDVLIALPATLMEGLFPLLLGAPLIWQGTAGLPSLLVLLALLVRLQPHAAALTHARVALMTLEGALENEVAPRRATDLAPLPSGPLPAVAPEQGIGLAGVGFRHHGARAGALVEATAMIPARRTTAIVGPSGAGKSTLLTLVCRLADPTAGVVLVDGQGLRRFDLASWRHRIGVVPRDVFLFNTTIRANIAYARPDATQAEIVAAAKAAIAHDFIAALPAGIDPVVGDRGTCFSGGQRQRLALARGKLAPRRWTGRPSALSRMPRTSRRGVAPRSRWRTGCRASGGPIKSSCWTMVAEALVARDERADPTEPGALAGAVRARAAAVTAAVSVIRCSRERTRGLTR